MARVGSRRSKKKQKEALRALKPPGSSPGTVITDPGAPKPILTVMAWNERELVEQKIADPREVCPLLERFPVVWLNVDGLGDANVIRAVGDAFKLHPLALEDVTDVRQRPKVDRFGDHHYIVAVMLEIDDGRLITDQLSLFVGLRYVITFQEQPGDCFGRLRERIRSGKGMIRTHGPGYLTYALLDATIDHYFPMLEQIGERLEALEDALVTRPDRSRLAEVHHLRRDLLVMRRAVWPLREALNFLIREDTPFFDAETKPYLNDCYDHTVQLMDLVENYREMASGMLDVFLSSMSNRMNEIMKVLTIISTIFMPLTFIAGVYGMNFPNIPETHTTFGYYAVLAVMLVTGIAMLLWFRKQGWIGRGARREPDHKP
jgi:magnesium transporter